MKENAPPCLTVCHFPDLKEEKGKTEMQASQYTVNSEFLGGFYFRETSHMRSFVKIKLSQDGKITL